MTLTLSEEQKQELVDAAVADIRAKAIQNATDNLSAWTRGAVAETLHVEVAALVKTEVVPAVKEALLAHKPILVEAAIAAASDMADVLRKAMLERLTKKLASEWDAKKLLKELFD